MKKLVVASIFLISVVFANEYQEWLKQQSSQYNEYKKSIDDEFADMLKKEWTSFETMYNPTPYEKPKPKQLPIVKKEIDTPKELIENSVKVKPKQIVKQELKKPVVKPAVQEMDYNNKEVIVNFFNQNLLFTYEKDFYFKNGTISKEYISSAWQKLIKRDFKKLIKQIRAYKNEYELNDWALYLLVNELGNKIYENQNQANIFTWFILTKMSYDTKIAYNKTNIYLLANVKEELFQIAFFRFDDKKYYVLSSSGKTKRIGSIFSYPSNYPNANQELSFDMNDKAIKFYTNIKSKDLKFDFGQKEYQVKSNYSQDLVDFYKTFPLSQYEIYFNSKNSLAIANSLLVQLRALIEGKSELEAVNLLLRFTQKSFAYKTDLEQFSYEKVLFPEETLYYEFSDCEDRSIMFAYLVKNLLGLDVIGLKYRGHIATAVRLSNKTDGLQIKYKNGIYTVADPTYINANVGISMPLYKKASFKIIE